MSNTLDKKELTNILKAWRAIVVGKDIWLDGDERAYTQIAALIGASKEVTEEWIEEEARDLLNKLRAYSALVGNEGEWGIVKDFIRSILTEIGVKVKNSV